MLQIESRSWSIVMLGSFNPVIFQPAWLAAQGLVSREQADASSEVLVHEQVTSFQIGDFELKCEHGRFQIQTSNTPQIALLDFCTKLFGEVLPHTKIESFGINTHLEVLAENIVERTAIGRKLAPTDAWGRFGKEIEALSDDEPGGMSFLAMRKPIITDGWHGYVEARLAPTVGASKKTGIAATINAHHVLNDYADGEGADRAARLLNDQYEHCLREADSYLSEVLEVRL